MCRSAAVPKVLLSDLNIYFWLEAREHFERLSLLKGKKKNVHLEQVIQNTFR